MSIHHLHDRGYKRLFSNLNFFRQLLESFVKEDWVKQLDFDSCEKLDKSYVSDKYKETTSDLLYKVKLAGREAYVCILLEFQSTCPHFMAVRVAHYLLTFYLDLFETDKKRRKVPAVFPIVIYNGESNWTAPTELRELIDNYELLSKFAPDFRYLTIIEKDYSTEELEQIGNLVSALFLTDSHHDIDKAKYVLAGLVGAEDPEDIELLMKWALFLLRGEKLTEEEYEELVQACQTREGVIGMLEKAIEREKQQYFAEGFAKAKAEKDKEIALKDKEIALKDKEIALKDKEIALKDKETASRLLADKVDINIIVHATGLSVDDIMKLHDENNTHH